MYIDNLMNESISHPAPCALILHKMSDNEEDGHRNFGGRHPVIFYRVPDGKYAGDCKTNSAG